MSRLSNILATVAAAAMFTATAAAQQPSIVEHINRSGSITVEQPAGLDARLQHPAANATTGEELSGEASGENAQATTTVPKVRAGYRVQVFDDNNIRTAKDQAQLHKSQIESRFPEYAAYVTFNSPYWRVKVGDFRTRSEAEAAMAEIRNAFPSMAKSLRIVRDRINQ